MKTVFVVPTGVDVRDPVTKRHLPRAGLEVPLSSYWVRRLNSGEVVAVEAPTVVNVNQIPDSQEIA